MSRIFLVLVFVFLPAIASAFTAGDFTVNNQPTYNISPGSLRVLILDLTLPEPPEGETLQMGSIKIHNAGTAQHVDLSAMSIWEDGASAGWDGDETEIVRVSESPFWYVDIKAGWNTVTGVSGSFTEYRYPSGTDPQQRIFVTVDLASIAVGGRTLQPDLVAEESTSTAAIQFVSGASGPSDENIPGFEREIGGGTVLTFPVSPLAQTPEALSDSAIRWHFLDWSNNEFGFRIYDSSLNLLIDKPEANLSYIDETNLSPNTQYSGRRVASYNDRGESLSSAQAVFSEIYTLAQVPSMVMAEATETSIKVGVENPPPNVAQGLSGLYFENMTLGANSGWIKEYSWASLELTAGEEYEFRVKARNGDGKETYWASSIAFETLVETEEEPLPDGLGAGPEQALTTAEALRAKIKELQLQLIELLKQLTQLLLRQITGLQANIYRAFEVFVNWFE